VSRRTEELLQDYLDGRLSPDARERFEAEIKGDAALAARIEAYREQRRALRTDVPDLSPGFYARARARFEETGPERKPRSFPRLSWELAGLAAAAALAGILFIPGLIEWEGKGKPFVEERPAAEKRQRSGEESPARHAVKNEKGGPAGAPIEAPAPAGDEKETASAPQDDSFDLEQERPAASRPAAGWAADEKSGLEREGPMPAAAARDKKGVRSAKMDRSAERLEAMKDAEAVRVIPRPKPLELPPGAVRPGASLVIETEEQWMNLVEGPARDSELALIAYDPAWRWILIGARPKGIDCAAIKIEVAAASYRITPMLPADPGRIAEWGCALPLPRDGRAIEIAEATDGGDE
jgi:hypothetical protein